MPLSLGSLLLPGVTCKGRQSWPYVKLPAVELTMEGEPARKDRLSTFLTLLFRTLPFKIMFYPKYKVLHREEASRAVWEILVLIFVTI